MNPHHGMMSSTRLLAAFLTHPCTPLLRHVSSVSSSSSSGRAICVRMEGRPSVNTGRCNIKSPPAVRTHSSDLTNTFICGKSTTTTTMTMTTGTGTGTEKDTETEAKMFSDETREASGSLTAPHVPVLVDELVAHLPDGGMHTVIDCTIGAGGHAHALLQSRGDEISKYIGIDRDEQAHAISMKRLHQAHSNGVLQLVRGNYADVKVLCEQVGVKDGDVDLILLDAGTSSMQLDDGQRGFSFMRDGPLDMRMDASGSGVSAADLVNGLEEEALANVIYEFGEERRSRRIAKAIVKARSKGRLESTVGLAEVIANAVGWRRRGQHPATLTFQALRIAVNGELHALEKGVRDAIQLLRPGGRMAVYSFHSLEDRIVKRVFKEMVEMDGGVRAVTRKPVMAGKKEFERNVRCRSAKLRVVERVGQGQCGRRVKVNKYRLQ